LWEVDDPLVLRLATLHNLSFFMRLMRELRESRDLREAAGGR